MPSAAAIKNKKNGNTSGIDQRSSEVLIHVNTTMTKIAFPVLIGLAVLLINIGYFLQYPEIIKGRSTVVRVDSAERQITIVLDIPQIAPGKVFVGQKIDLLFDLYPNNKYGALRGILQQVDFTQNNNNITARIYLPDMFNSNQHHQIPCRTGLKSNALIMIRERRLLQRLFQGKL